MGRFANKLGNEKQSEGEGRGECQNKKGEGRGECQNKKGEGRGECQDKKGEGRGECQERETGERLGNKSKDECLPPANKRGRPEKWIPRVLSGEDKASAFTLREQYGPDVQAAMAFESKYRFFCASNNLDPASSSSVIFAMGQAKQMGAAASSMQTNFSTLLKRKVFNIRNKWELEATLRNFNADSDPVQPRLYDPIFPDIDSGLKRLCTIISNIQDVEHQALGCMCQLTGARAQTIVRLRGKQTLLKDDALWIERRWSKVKNNRSQRDRLQYLFEWTKEPPSRVMTWIKSKSESDELIFKGSQFTSRAAATLTNALRKSSGDDTITSYVFRDFLSARLPQFDLPKDEIERLLEHTDAVTRASYLTSDLSKQSTDKIKAARAVEKSSRKGKTNLKNAKKTQK